MKKCFICGESEKVISFTGETFDKCLNFIALRKSKHFKYGEIDLLPESKEMFGYHIKCYRKLTIKQKYIDDSDKIQQKRLKSADIDLNAHPSSSTTWLDANQMGEPQAMNLLPETLLYNAQPSTSTTSLDANEMKEQLEFPLPHVKQPSKVLIYNKTNSKCIFCSKIEKRLGCRRQYVSICTTEDMLSKIEEIAETLEDTELIDKLRKYKSFAYHPTCRIIYIKKYNSFLRNNLQQQSNWHELRHIHKEAFEALSAFIVKEIIQEENLFYLSDLFWRYKALLVELSDSNFSKLNFESYTPQYLEKKILSVYGNIVVVTVSEAYNKRKIIYKNGIDMNKLINESLIKKSAEISKFQDVAYDLRNTVKSINKKRLPEKLTPDDIVNGECDIPDQLLSFVSYLVQGPDIRRNSSDNDCIKIKSLCQDIIYIISKGRIKPAKHLMLGLSMKSLTSSKKVLTILNRYGHSVGYTVASQLETEMTYAACEENRLVPPGIHTDNRLSTHVAFDNFDRYVETLNGKDTLHDTVGIIYQFTPTESETLHTNSITSTSSVATTSISYAPRKRRRFEQIPRDIQPYLKKPAAKTNLLPLHYFTSAICDDRVTKEDAVLRDLLWAISLSKISNTPMWIGFNSKTILDNSETQSVDYLPQINLSPTSYAVVHETLIYAQEIANECHQSEIILTYDLAIAKMAMQIQITESPKFDNVFINLGAFHIQMAFFKALGKYVDASGVVDILLQSEVLAAGSVNGLIDGKHFNRCKRIHPLLSGALQTLHFEQFCLENDITISEEIIQDLQLLQNNSSESHKSLHLNPLLADILKQYRTFIALTLKGDHGKTPKFYMQYIEFMNIFFRFSRSIRTSDFELYIESIFDLSNLFFVFNQPNYARWILKYHSNLVDLKIKNSALLNEFRRGAFGVKRTVNNLARSPVDLTLEQTINADAANSLKGVTHFTNSISARQRWALSHNMRTKIISKMLAEIGMGHQDDISHELAANRIEKDKQSLFEIINAFKQNINPFDPSVNKDHLFNIATGRAASDQTSDFLLNVNSLGEDTKKTFIEECTKDLNRFEKPLKRNKIYNFSSECVKKVQRSKDGNKQVLIKMERDVFGKLLATALEKKIDMEICLSYPLSPAPPALCHCSGEMYKTDKSVLAKKLKSRVSPSIPSYKDIDLIDGFYFLHILGPSVPQTFERISEMILRRICATDASEIHLVFDRYLSPSIKDFERLNRQEHEIPYTIIGPSQNRPNDFIKSLKNIKFKQALIKFLAIHWEGDFVATILGDKKVYLTVDDKCFSFEAKNRIVSKVEEIIFQCYHEEADTRLIYHLSKSKPYSKVMVKASDTDILIILLGNIQKFKDMEIWLTSGYSRSNDLNCINCTQLSVILGPTVCSALPAFHAFTGCDYTASFYRKGKAKPLGILERNDRFITLFGSLNNEADIQDIHKIEAIQEYTALLYGVKNCKNVNSARVRMFQNLYATKHAAGNFFKNMKNFDSSLIPPCYKSLQQKIRRTIFVSSMWLNATDSSCIKFRAEEFGWVKINEKLVPFWFKGEPTPLSIDDIVIKESDDELSDTQTLDDSDDADDF